MKFLSSFFGFLAILIWFAAIVVLFIQIWDFAKYGFWTNVPIHAAFTAVLGFRPSGTGLITQLLIWDLLEQSLSLALALIGLAAHGLAQILDP